MAFSLKQTPVYGGATLLVEFSLDVPLSSMGAYYVVYEGSQQRHVTTARLISPTRLHSIVPSHNIPEDVLVTVVDFQGKDKPSTTLATSSIVFERDGVLHLAQFLIDSVFHLHALENHELIKSDDFNLADEELSSLDWRLRRALTYLTIPDWWSTLGDELNSDHPSPRESLLHFAARLGLTKVAHFFLRKAGSETLLTLPNHQGQLPKDVALDNGFCGLAELLSEYNLKSLLPLGGWIVKEEGRVQTQDTGDVTLTSDIKTHHRSIDEDIKVLQVIQLQVDIGDTDFTSCWQTEWPTAVTAPDMTTADESTTDQMFQEICEKAEELSGIISADDYGDTSEDTYTDPNLDSQHAPAEAWAGEECEVAMETEEATHGHHDGESDDNELMEGSIELIHGVNEQLLARIHEKAAGLQRILDQDLRAENLARFSTSCPHLDVAARNSPLPVIDEADISRSMVDLLDDNTDDCRDGPSSVCSGDTYSSSTPNLADNPVQVTVDGTTLESSSDFGLQAQEYDQCLTDYNNGNVQQVRHRSPLLVRQNGQETAANNMLIHGSKSAQLTPDEDDTDDDSFQNYGSVGYLNSPSDPYRRQLHSVSDVADGKAASLKRDGMSRGSANKNRYSADIETMMRSSKDSPEAMSPMGSGVRSSIHGFMHNKITKAFSMSSIPAATNAEKGKGGTYKGSDKHAQFHNGGKIPEEDYDNPDRHPNSLSHKKQKPEITLLDFLNDSSNFTDSTISLSQKTKEKDEKKRKGGVFSRFNSYRSKTKKNKDKEGKENKNRSSQHRFVSVSFSNATRCDVCHKVLNNKPALRCQSCELNVHESSCKENLTPCDKSRLKGQVPRQSSTENEAMIGGPEPIVSGLVNHSRSASFRDNTTRVPAVYVGSVSQPLYGAEPPLQPEVAKMYTSQDKGQRKSLPSPSRAIVEEEGDSGNVSRLSPIHASADSITRSTESLDEVDAGVRTYHYDESELNALDVQEPENWSETVDKKILKKLHSKDIKRQDTIWELIQTERQYCKRLKTLQLLFRDGMVNELHMPPQMVNSMFPRLDDLTDVHMEFLRTLQMLQSKRPDKMIDEIGATLVGQFSGAFGDKMKASYGMFCSAHLESVQNYKDMMMKDRKFQQFIKTTTEHPMCQKREIPDFIQIITQRPTKYPILIDSILHSTKEKKELEQLMTALERSRDVLKAVDDQVDAAHRAMKLRDISNRLDVRSHVMHRGKKLKNKDILQGGRVLRHEGIVGLKMGRGGKAVEVLAVLLNDILFFLQENNQKYSFYSQDNKYGVVSLFNLLVREKQDERDTKGIYLISQNKQAPVMFEIVFNSTAEMSKWAHILRQTVAQCPEEEEEEITGAEEDRRKLEEKFAERSARAQNIIEKLRQIDEEIREQCDAKNRLIVELLSVFSEEEQPSSRPCSQNLEELPTSAENTSLEACLSDVSSQLTALLQGKVATNLGRCVSSVGEYSSNTFVNSPLLKKAETFAGFDNAERKVKRLEGEDVRDSYVEPPMSADISDLDLSHNVSKTSYDSEGESGHGSSPSLTTSTHSALSVPPVLPSPGFQEQPNIANILRTFNSVVHMTVSQVTANETLKAQLAQANEKINKLAFDVHDKKGGFKHNQLEELRNLQGVIQKEKKDLERQKERDLSALEQEKLQLEDLKNSLNGKEAELKQQKEKLAKDKETLQKQMDMLRQSGKLPRGNEASDVPDIVTEQLKPDFVPVHRRSASDESFKSSKEDSPRPNSSGASKENNFRPENKTVTKLQSFNFGSNKKDLPVHLLSAFNEQKIGTENVSKLLSSGASSTSLPDKATVSRLRNSSSGNQASFSQPQDSALASDRAQMEHSASLDHIRGPPSVPTGSAVTIPAGNWQSNRPKSVAPSGLSTSVLKLAIDKGDKKGKGKTTPPQAADKGPKSRASGDRPGNVNHKSTKSQISFF